MTIIPWTGEEIALPAYTRTERALRFDKHCGPPHSGGALLQHLRGKWDGGPAMILGCGPSLLRFNDQAVIDAGFEHQRFGVIATNSAVHYYPGAGVWLTAESAVHKQDWFWSVPPHPSGLPRVEVHDVGLLFNGLEEESARRGDLWGDDEYGAVFWNRRECLDRAATGFYDPDTKLGLFAVTENEWFNGEPMGSVAMQAADLALRLGAAELHFWGCEFCWDDEQHWNGINCFNDDAPEHCRPVQLEDGRWSTPYFIESAKVLLWFLKETGCKWTDHSGGLLNGPSVV